MEFVKIFILFRKFVSVLTTSFKHMGNRMLFYEILV